MRRERAAMGGGSLKAMSDLVGWLLGLEASNWIALLALIVSGIIAFLHFRSDRQIQRRLLAIEEERDAERRRQAQQANLRAYLQKSGSQNYHLVIDNDGEAGAQEVRVTLDGKTLMEHPLTNRYIRQEIRTVGPHSEVKYIAAVSGDCPPPYHIVIQWKDGWGRDGFYHTTLTF
jgi:hypothetical protein